MPVSLETVTHIVKDLFRRPVSELMSDATHSLNRLSSALAKSGFLRGLIMFLSGGTNSTTDKITAGSLPPASFSIGQT